MAVDTSGLADLAKNCETCLMPSVILVKESRCDECGTATELALRIYTHRNAPDMPTLADFLSENAGWVVLAYANASRITSALDIVLDVLFEQKGTTNG